MLRQARCNMRTMADRFYTDEQAQEILSMAARTSMGSGDISRDQLLATAAELGIRPEELIHAENAFLAKQQLASDRVAFRRHKGKEFYREFSRWLSLAILLYGICFVTRGFELRGLLDDWPKWPVGFMGLFVVKNAIEVCLDLTLNRGAVFEKWRQKHGKPLTPNSLREAESATPPVVNTADAVLDANLMDRNQARS